MENNEKPVKRDAKWGTYLVAGLIVAAVCLGVLVYIGWLDNKAHIDSRNGDNVMATYQVDTPQPNAPEENDWNNPDHNSLREIIVDHAEGTNTTPLPE